MRRAAVRGAGATVFAAGASFFVQIGATMILARLLTPADFGIVTMVTTFSLLFCSFGLNGFTEGILQWKEIKDDLTSNLFWINLGICALLTVVFIFLAPLLALFYHNPLVVRVAQGMSLTIVLGGLGWIHMALLKRAMRFKTVSAISIAARLLSVITSIVLAMLGWGYWALVVGQVVVSIATSIGAWWMCRWIPTLPNRVEGTSSAVKFAINVYSHFAFSYVTRNTDNLLVGWRFSAQALGFYKKAYDLFVLPESQLIAPISAVVVTTLSRLNHDRDQYQRYFLTGISVLAFVGMGIGIDITLVGRDVIRFLLGPGWEEAGRIFSLFGPGIGVMLLYDTHGWIHLSSGRPDRWFRWGVIEFICTVGLFVMALPWGPAGIALAWTISYFVLLLPAFWYAGTPINLPVGAVLGAVWKSFVASGVAGGSAVVVIHFMPLVVRFPGALGALVKLVWVSLLFSALYLIAVVSLYRGLGPVNQTLSLIRDAMPRRKNKKEESVATVENRVAAVPALTGVAGTNPQNRVQ
ncbi:MAG: lipopolysaccharide biosynthesis protein [Candidatus Korobacteraceae bacterium]